MTVIVERNWFQYESGEPWCEAAYKYQTLPMIAEFFNTITNLPIIALPLLNVLMLREYIRAVNSFVFLPHLFLTINGLASTYYHATLNLFGQLVDEISILWMINICVVAFLPVFRCCPQKYRERITAVRWAIVCLTAVISCFCFLKPSLNAFALMTFSLPGIALIYFEGVKGDIKEVAKLTWRIFILWALAMAFWFSDKLLCDLWLKLGIPYMHAVFHLLSSVAAYNVFLMFSLLDIEKRRKAKEHSLRAEIRYFPFPEGNHFNLAYISVNGQDRMNATD